MREQRLAVRQPEIVASLSLGADIGMGQPAGQSLRTCLLALGVAREMGLADQDCKDVCYLKMLRFVGCNAHADHNASATGGDEMTFRQGMATVINGEPAEVASHMVRHLGSDTRASTGTAKVCPPECAAKRYRSRRGS